MRRLGPYRESSDARGRFLGIVNSGTWEEINYLETAAGQVRGGHYHEHTVELFYILEGEIDVEISDPDESAPSRFHVCAGDIFLVEPGEAHAFRCQTHCRWINALSTRMDERVPDIRLPVKRRGEEGDP